MKITAVFLIGFLVPFAAFAQGNLAADAEMAAAQISKATSLLEQASGSDDQVLALGGAITAFENGLRVLRDSMQRASLREQALSADYDFRRDALTRTLGTLYAIESQPAPLILLHPDGPLAAAQSAQLLAELTPVLRANADALRRQIDEIAALKSLRETTANNLRDGLAGLLNARAALEDAIAQGDPVPALFVEDRMQIQILAAMSDSMTAFAQALTKLRLPPFDTPKQLIANAELALPVAGRILHGFNQEDAAGLRRPGIVVEAAPLALVSTPFDATIRFAGPFLDYGNVVVLEPEAGTLLILAGMARLFRAEGDVLTTGDPVGFLGGTETADEELLIEASTETGVQANETLYIELRKDGESVDPAPLFKQQ